LSVSGPLDTSLYREWVHFPPRSKRYYPDALVPTPASVRAELPAPDNRIANQTAQSYWLDIWVPASVRPGTYTVEAVLESGGAKSTLPVRIQVLDAVVPADDPVIVDHNSYGTNWMLTQYSELAARNKDFYLSDDFFALIHAY